jgi:uncharacterized protein YecT (DUF1311 family)
MTKVTIAILVLACLSFSAYAEDNPYSQRYNSCMDNSGGVTVEMHNCIGDEHTRQDSRLNQAYKKLTSQLSASRKKQFLTAQRLWIQYRDANCQFYADPDGGTMATINAASCGLEMTAQRAKELENLTE